MESVTFASVSKTFGDGTRAVRGMELTIAGGEFMVLVGPSGCGKTTALRMLAGLETVTDGEIMIGDRRVNDVDPADRDIAMVFQNYALYPHMTVFDNIGFGLKMRGTSKREIAKRVLSIAETLGLTPYLKRKPAHLSGGQRQRVAMGRAIVRQPSVFLMDEPLSNLDARLRVQMRSEIARIQRDLRTTTIYVTHDQVEAMTMADRVAVMRGGELQQVDVPQHIYEAPANLFVASFIGSPPMNLAEATLRETPLGLSAFLGNHELALPAVVSERHPTLLAHTDQRIGLGFRPEHLRLERRGADDLAIQGQVVMVEALGSELLVHFTVNAAPVVTDEVLDVVRDTDAAIAEDLLWYSSQGTTMVIGRFEPDARITAQDTLEPFIDPLKFHFFDLKTGLAL